MSYHPPVTDLRERLETIFEELVRPLLAADGGDAEVVDVDGERVTLRVSGSAAYGVGSHYVRASIIERALAEVRAGLIVDYEKVAERPPKRAPERETADLGPKPKADQGEGEASAEASSGDDADSDDADSDDTKSDDAESDAAADSDDTSDET